MKTIEYKGFVHYEELQHMTNPEMLIDRVKRQMIQGVAEEIVKFFGTDFPYHDDDLYRFVREYKLRVHTINEKEVQAIRDLLNGRLGPGDTGIQNFRELMRAADDNVS
jgi:hypothetical protein